MSNDTKWTPGPWRVMSRSDDGMIMAGRIGATDSNGNSWVVADPNPNVIQPEFNANTLLIASAPELYQKLESMCSMWKSVCDSYGWDPEHMSQYESALEELAKARGVSHD